MAESDPTVQNSESTGSRSMNMDQAAERGSRGYRLSNPLPDRFGRHLGFGIILGVVTGLVSSLFTFGVVGGLIITALLVFLLVRVGWTTRVGFTAAALLMFAV